MDDVQQRKWLHMLTRNEMQLTRSMRTITVFLPDSK